MFGLFRRNKNHRVSHTTHFPMVLMSIAQSLKPMKHVEFEMADQSLQDVFEWLAEQRHSQWLNGGHYSLSAQMAGHYQLKLSHYLESQTLPVIFSNCTEGILHALPLVMNNRKEVGIIHIGNQFEIKAALEPELGSAYHFALSRFNDLRLCCVGIDRARQNEKIFEYAEDLGCNWLTLSECQFAQRFHLREQLDSYLADCGHVILNIDLMSLSCPSQLSSERSLDVQMVNRVINQVLSSGKIALVQLVGWKDKHIFAKSTLSILQELAAVLPTTDRVA